MRPVADKLKAADVAYTVKLDWRTRTLMWAGIDLALAQLLLDGCHGKRVDQKLILTGRARYGAQKSRMPCSCRPSAIEAWGGMEGAALRSWKAASIGGGMRCALRARRQRWMLSNMSLVWVWLVHRDQQRHSAYGARGLLRFFFDGLGEWISVQSHASCTEANRTERPKLQPTLREIESSP